MIVATSGSKRVPYPRLAYTLKRDSAYYLDGDATRMLRRTGAELYDDEDRSAISPSGAPWIPDFLSNGRLTMFIAGNPGAGKSFLANDIIETFPPDYDVLLFTALEEEDANFRDLGSRLWKIRMDPENLKRITLSEIRARTKHPILLFDDIDKIRDKRVETEVYKILEDALANGRGHKSQDGRGDVHIIVTSHALNDYKKTKYVTENSDYVALFPGSTTKAQYDRMFQKLGLPMHLCDETYEKGKRGDIRSVIIKKTAPMYIIFGDRIDLI